MITQSSFTQTQRNGVVESNSAGVEPFSEEKYHQPFENVRLDQTVHDQILALLTWLLIKIRSLSKASVFSSISASCWTDLLSVFEQNLLKPE